MTIFREGELHEKEGNSKHALGIVADSGRHS